MPRLSSTTAVARPAERRGSPLVRLVIAFALALVLALVGAGCGSSGGGDDSSGGGGSPTGPASSEQTLELFQASIDAIDPGAPGSVIPIDPDAAELDADRNPIGALSAIGGTFSAGTLASAQVEWVVYPRDDGTLQRVSTDRDAGPPTPVRVSSEPAALPFCDARIANDLSDATNARLAYGTDRGTCEDELVWRVVTLSDDELTDPRDFPGQPLEALVDHATGAHLGWLTLDGGRLSRLAPDLSIETPDLLVGVQRGESIGATAKGTLFLELDQALYAYDPDTNALEDLDFAFSAECPCGGSFASDREYGFLIDAGGLHRANPKQGTVQLVESPDDALTSVSDPLDFVTVGASRVAWSYPSDADGNLLTLDDRETVIRSVGRDGSAGLELDRYVRSTTPIPPFSGFVAASSDEWLFYNRFTVRSTGPVAMSVKLAGGESRFSIAVLWVGSSRAPTVGPPHSGPLTRMLQLAGLYDLADLASNGSLELDSVDPDDPRGVDVELGELPSDALFAYGLPGFGPDRVGVLLSPDGFGDLQSDLVFWHDETPGSLLRVSETNGRNEFPAPLF